MTESEKFNLRRRKQDVITQNGITKQDEEKKGLPEFMHRDSPLTVLIEGSLHIRAIYHIFVVILVVLLCDTVIYDFVERGKINIGATSVIYGFGDIRRGAKIWLLELAIALAFYPGLRLYAGTRKFLVKFPAALKIWSIMGMLGVAVLEVMVIAIPTWDLGKKHLALASSVAVTCEMFRFAMKIHAAAVACAPRCQDDLVKLPTFKHYVYFLFAPTLVYRDEYPRTKKIRWGVVLFHFLEVTAIIFYNSFLWERFILPYWSDYGKEPKLLHAWHNAFAEMLTFGDRLFYEEWWTTSQFSRYYRAWNRVVHSWLRDHIYKPLSPRAGRVLSILTVFAVSAVAHEVILSLSFGFFYPVLMMEFGGFGLIMLPLTASTGRRFPSFLNLLMWLSFFLGNGLLWSLYPMEFFARKNCPQSENDSYFIPKSWSCPEIVLKPNWSFQNPFNIIF
ncbi:PREDICTED: sterol O-acyltransferase 2 [Papilio polytes]|uniref:sterol O-acyltransferase 2 n=1 Tax=Papilio polytes TaxID=76194 RepID=UPI0006767964|nr:PREDICTED: sterol O-acyltransferase 2 [Papilio polytes]